MRASDGETSWRAADIVPHPSENDSIRCPLRGLAHPLRGHRPMASPDLRSHHIGTRLASLRQKQDRSRRWLARKAGLSDVAIGQIEEGSRTSAETVERLALALEVPPCYLAYGCEGCQGAK